MSNDEDIARVEKALDSLADFFETVHIFVTRHSSDNEGTVGVTRGSGNWYARYGQVKEWALRQEEAANIQERKNNESDE